VPQGVCGHNGSYLLLDGKKVPGSEVPPALYMDDGDEPEDETTETQGKAPAPKAGKKVTGKGYRGYLVKYGTGRRSIESLIGSVQRDAYGTTNFLFQWLADAKRMGHPNFDQWLETAVDWHTRAGATLNRLKSRACPTSKEIEALLDLDQQQDEAGDPATAPEPEPEPAAPEAVGSSEAAS